MKITVTTKAPMDDIENCLAQSALEIKQKTNNELVYFVNRDGDTTTIDIPQIDFTIKGGRLNGMKVKLKRRMLRMALEAACLKNGHKAQIEIV
jgi:hypothetical protein